MDTWCRRTGHPQGAVLDLDTLWRLSRVWYAGRMDEEWQPRSAAAAGAVLEACGLRGPFWEMG